MGIYRWMVELGRIDILTDVSMLLLHMALQCQEAALHIMSDLLLHHNSGLCMDPMHL